MERYLRWRNSHPGLFALYAVSAWCLMSPALLRHVHIVRDGRLHASLTGAPVDAVPHRRPIV